jgi:hypothetical protein
MALRPLSLSSLPPARPLRPAAPTAARALTVTARPAALFDYPGVALKDLSVARPWTPGSKGMSGSDANLVVTATYSTFDTGMSTFLGEPALPNWMTFGKYASREAGSQILRMEEVLKITQRLDSDSLVDTLQDFAQNPFQLGDQGMQLLKYSKNPIEFIKNAEKMRDSLVFGNTGVYADIAPAYDIFLRAVSTGKDGVAALKAAGYGSGARDPQGLLLEAFTHYQRAKTLGDRAALLPPPERQKLLDARFEAINRANFLIGIHEQMIVIQGPQIFGDPEIHRMLAALSEKMSLTDAVGTHKLLPYGGNWANFADRMGFAEVPAGSDPAAFKVVDHQGMTHHYVLHPSPIRREGTIGQYFLDTMDPVKARTMIQSQPQPLPDSYLDGNDVWRTIKAIVGVPFNLAKRAWAKLTGRTNAATA